MDRQLQALEQLKQLHFTNYLEDWKVEGIRRKKHKPESPHYFPAKNTKEKVRSISPIKEFRQIKEIQKHRSSLVKSRLHNFGGKTNQNIPIKGVVVPVVGPKKVETYIQNRSKTSTAQNYDKSLPALNSIQKLIRNKQQRYDPFLKPANEEIKRVLNHKNKNQYRKKPSKSKFKYSKMLTERRKTQTSDQRYSVPNRKEQIELIKRGAELLRNIQSRSVTLLLNRKS